MKTNPLSLICIFFCLGIWAAKYVHIPLFFVFVSCSLFLLTALVSLKRQVLFFLSLSLAIFLAGFIHLGNFQTHPANHISNFVSDEGQKVYLTGKVVSNPEVSQTFYHSEKISFTFRVNDLKVEGKWQPVEGLIKVTCYGERKIQYADELLLQGLLERPPGLRNPGGFKYRDYLANHNIFGTLKVKEKEAFRVISSSKKFSFIREIFQFKQRLHRIIFEYLQPKEASLLSAILLGERSELSQDIKDLFIKTGTIHILAISGLHVGLISLILIALFKFLRLRRNLTFIFTIFLLVGYAALSGMRPSVVRATIMAVVVLLGLLINREINIYNSLGLAALIILIFRPHYLFDSGFQLSFLSVISIVYFAPKIGGPKAFSVSLVAWIGITPLAAYYFNIVTPVAVLANLVVIPCLFLVVSTGIVFLIFAYLWAPLGAIFGQTCSFSLLGLTTLTSFISKIPLGFFRCPRPGIFFFYGYYALVLLIFNHKKLKISLGRLGIILVLVANFLAWKPLFETPSDKLTVTFLDVGLGDAIFIEFPYSSGTMLIDGGAAKDDDAGRWVILPFLWNKGIKKIDAVVLTHPDNDHIGGLASVLKNIKVNYVFDNGMSKESRSYNAYKTRVAREIAHYRVIKRGERILGFPQVKLFVLHPPEHFLKGDSADTNNNSLVLKLVYKDVGFIFCADIKKQAIKQILPYSSMLKSTVMKVPHHGSNEGRVEDYLFQATSAQLAVISVDRNNRFGFPAPEVVERLERIGTKVYKTSDSGAVIISTDGKNVWVETITGAEAGI